MFLPCFVCTFRKLVDGLFLECCREVAAQYPDIVYEELIIDKAVLMVHALFVCSVCLCSVPLAPTMLLSSLFSLPLPVAAGVEPHIL